jgi:uncharacterized protein YjiS (DUF1127 family)
MDGACRVDLEDAMSAMTTTSRPTAPFARTILTMAGAMRRRISGFARAYRNRSDAAVLATLDERTLADMGLTRSDVRDAFAEPLWHDPTDLLRARALERRLARHRVLLGLKDAGVTAPPLVPQEHVQPPATSRPARVKV